MSNSLRLHETCEKEAFMIRNRNRFPRFFNEDIRQLGIFCKGKDLLGITALKTHFEVFAESFVCAKPELQVALD